MSLYAFLSGKIRVLENNLLNQMDVDRMVDAPDFDSAFKALNDTDYGAHLLDVEPHQFQDALDQDFRSVRELMMQWIEDKHLMEFMFLQFDAHNVKLYFKAKQVAESDSQMTVDPYTLPIGLTDPELVKQIILDEQAELVIHPTTDRLIKDSLERMNAEPNGFEIDSTVDRILLNLLDERIAEITNPIIRDLYRIQKDTIWLKTFLRAKRMNKEMHEVEKILPSRFSRYYQLDEEQAIQGLSLTPALRKAAEGYLEHKQLWQLEKELEEAELSVIRRAKYKTNGIEPVVGYFYAKKNAVRNIRLILTGKMNSIDAAEIKKRVRELY